jgi:hypothetical protein
MELNFHSHTPEYLRGVLLKHKDKVVFTLWVTGLLTRHCHLKGHLFKTGLTNNPFAKGA